MKSIRTSLLVFFVFAFAITAFANCTADSWTGGIGYWSDVSFWSLGSVPTICNPVAIATGNDYVTLAPDQAWAAASLQVGNSVSGNSTLFLNDPNYQDYYLTVAGNLSLSPYGHLLGYWSYVNVGGNLDNSGEFSIAAFTVNITGALQNSGQWENNFIRSSYIDLTAGSVNNSGQFLLHGDYKILGDFANSGTVFPSPYDPFSLDVGGTLTNLSGREIFLMDPYSVHSTTVSTLENFGQINLDGTNAIGSLQNHGDFLFGLGSNSASYVYNDGSLEIFGYHNASLDVSANAVNRGAMVVGYCGDYYEGCAPAAMYVHGSLTNSGRIEMGLGEFGGPGILQLASLDNSGSLDLHQGSILRVANHAENSGIISTMFVYFRGSLDGNNVIAIDTLTNRRAISLDAPWDNASFRVLDNRGNISLSFDTTLCLEVDQTCSGSILQAGTLNNAGDIDVVTNSALVVGNGSAFTGGYYQLADGTLGETISAAGFGVIVVADGASLDGTLRVLLEPGYDPTVGSTYKFLTFLPGGLTGEFASIQNQFFNGGSEMWLVLYDNSDGWVELKAAPATTPEASSLLLVGTGLIGVVSAIRRKFKLQSHLPAPTRDQVGSTGSGL